MIHRIYARIEEIIAAANADITGNISQNKSIEGMIHMSLTKIAPCTCKHAYQDRHYGKNRRVHNEMGKGGQKSGWRCTICKAQKGA